MISQVCEEFHCTPSQAVRELDREPELVGEVLMLRSYARTKQQLDDATTDSDTPKGPMADLVTDIEFDLHEARKARYADGE